MISNEKLESIISECKKTGFEVRIRDISYVLLCRFIADRNVIYKSVFGSATNDTEIELYDQSKSISFLKTYLKDIDASGTKTRKKKEADISFEENKAAMLSLLEEAKEKYNNGEIEAKDYLKITSDVRVRLNDKFSVKEDTQDQVIFVNQKYDEEVCPYCHHEIARKPISKEDAMEMYNLIEKPDNKDAGL